MTYATLKFKRILEKYCVLFKKYQVDDDILPIKYILSVTQMQNGNATKHSGAPSTGKTWTCWSGARGGHSNDPRAGTPLLWGKAEKVGAVHLGEE